MGCHSVSQIYESYCIPVQFLNVHKYPHQLRYGHSRMSIIQLDGNLKHRHIESHKCVQRRSFKFNWLKRLCVVKLTLSGKLSNDNGPEEFLFEVLKRRITSCKVAATTKYSCFKRSSFPSKNYNTHQLQSVKKMGDKISDQLKLDK